MSNPQIQVVAYDGSTLSERALRRAVVDASSLDFAVLHIVSVVEDLDDHNVRLPTGEVLSRFAARESLRLTVEELLRTWQVPTRMLRVSGHLRSGDTAQAIVDLAYRHHAERILLGSQSDGSGSIGRVGRTARRVMSLADFPVHLESPHSGASKSPEFDPVRFAFVFGGASAARMTRERELPQA